MGEFTSFRDRGRPARPARLRPSILTGADPEIAPWDRPVFGQVAKVLGRSRTSPGSRTAFLQVERDTGSASASARRPDQAGQHTPNDPLLRTDGRGDPGRPPRHRPLRRIARVFSGLPTCRIAICQAEEGAPGILGLVVLNTADLTVDLVQVLTPLPSGMHGLNAPTPAISSKHWAEPVPPVAHYLIPDPDTAFVQQTFNTAK